MRLLRRRRNERTTRPETARVARSPWSHPERAGESDAKSDQGADDGTATPSEHPGSCADNAHYVNSFGATGPILRCAASPVILRTASVNRSTTSTNASAI